MPSSRHRLRPALLLACLLLALHPSAALAGGSVERKSRNLSRNRHPAFPPSENTAPRAAMATKMSSVKLAQYAPAAASLFNNMKTPASILAGGLVPLGFLAPLPPYTGDGPEPILAAILRRVYLFIAVSSLSSELISVMWATVAVNKLTETTVAPAASVWALITRDYDLPWLGTNAHFVLGMFGFCWMVGTRAYLALAGSPFGVASAGMSISGLLLMVSIVNRGVAAGAGEGLRYGGTVLALLRRYCRLLLQQATAGCSAARSFGPLELMSMLIASGSVVLVLWAAMREATAKS